jgi:hypothetical protein
MRQKTDLERAFEALHAKQTPYTEYWNYYDGDAELKFSTDRLYRVFGPTEINFNQNWSAVVADSANNRIDLQRFEVADDAAATAALNAQMESQELFTASYDVHLDALVTGEGFVIAWPDAAGEMEAFYNDSRQVHLFYEPDNPRKKRYAAKWFSDMYTGVIILTLYYADRVEYYQAEKSTIPGATLTAKAFIPVLPSDGGGYVLMADGDMWPGNPTGEVPVFRFPRLWRKTQSELKNAISPQDAISKLNSDMMVASEFGSFKQRWLVTNADTETLKNAPNEIWSIPAGDGEGEGTQVGEFSAADLGGYIEAMVNQVSAISATTQTPAHLFFTASATVPSGEALIALEAPLNKKCAIYIQRFKKVWEQLAAFMLRWSGMAIEADRINAVFATPSTVQPKTQSEINKTNVDSGMPLETTLRRSGWTDAELMQLEADQARARAQQEQQLALALIEAERRASQNGNRDDNLSSAAPAAAEVDPDEVIVSA